MGNSAQNQGKSHDAWAYAVLSFVLGAIAGFFTIRTGFLFYYAGYPAHGPVGVFGGLFLVLGSLTVIGSVMVLIKKIRLLGAILILIFGLLSSFTGGIFYSVWGYLMLGIIGYIIGYIAGWLLPLTCFILALYARKIDRARTRTKQP